MRIKRIFLEHKTQGTHVLLIDEKYEHIINQYSWIVAYVSAPGKVKTRYEKPPYIYRNYTDHSNTIRRYGVEYLHRHICKLEYGNPNGLVVDFINGNTLDCRVANMRYVTVAENNKNARTGSKYIGVVRDGHKWISKPNAAYPHQKRFNTELEAAQWYATMVGLNEPQIKPCML